MSTNNQDAHQDTHSEASSKSVGSMSITEPVPLTKVEFSGTGDEYVTIGNQKFLRHELMQAFGGTLTAGVSPYPKFSINPAPVGLSAFALTTFILSMVNAQAMGVKVTNVVVGSACFYGGAVQFLAGVGEFFASNTFGATALTSYGAFWLSYAAIELDAFGIVAAYADEPEQLANALGFYLLGWALFTFMLVLCTLKSTVAFCGLFSFLCMTFILLAGGEFSGHAGVTRAGGVFGVITAFLGWYNAFAGTANKQNSYITAHAIMLPGNLLRTHKKKQ